MKHLAITTRTYGDEQNRGTRTIEQIGHLHEEKTTTSWKSSDTGLRSKVRPPK